MLDCSRQRVNESSPGLFSHPILLSSCFLSILSFLLLISPFESLSLLPDACPLSTFDNLFARTLNLKLQRYSVPRVRTIPIEN